MRWFRPQVLARVRLDDDEQTVFVPAAAIANAALDPRTLAPDDLRVHLHNKLQLAKAARNRSAWLFGRIYNQMSGEEPDHIALTGARLVQVLEIVGRSTPDAIDHRTEYLTPCDVATEALKALSQ